MFWREQIEVEALRKNICALRNRQYFHFLLFETPMRIQRGNDPPTIREWSRAFVPPTQFGRINHQHVLLRAHPILDAGRMHLHRLQVAFYQWFTALQSNHSDT
jgi:hypothetical protein